MGHVVRPVECSLKSAPKLLSQLNRKSKSIRFQWPRLNYFQDHPISYHHIFVFFAAAAAALPLMQFHTLLWRCCSFFRLLLGKLFMILNVSSCQAAITFFSFNWYESYLWLHNRCIYLSIRLYGNCYRKSIAMQPDLSNWNKTNIITLFFLMPPRRQQTYLVFICTSFSGFNTHFGSFHSLSLLGAYHR